MFLFKKKDTEEAGSKDAEDMKEEEEELVAPPPTTLSRVTTRADPTNRNAGVRRAKLERSATEEHKMKESKLVLHAKLTGRANRHQEVIAPAEDMKLQDPAQNPNTEKTEHEKRFIEDSLTDGDNFVFEFMTHDERANLIEHMECVCYREGGLIIRQGDDGDYFYVIKEGVVNVHVSKEQQDMLLANAQREQSTRRLTVVPEDDQESDLMASFLAGGPLPVGKPGSPKPKRNNSLLIDSFTSIEPAGVIPPPMIPSDMLRNLDFDSDEEDDKDDDDSFDAPPPQQLQQWKEEKHKWDEKHLQVQKEPPVAVLGPGDTFGELALLYNCPRLASCLAGSNVTLWRLHTKTFRAVMGGHTFQKQQDGSDGGSFSRVSALQKVELFSNLDENTISRIAHALIPVRFRKGELIGRKGEIANNFFIIQDGEVILHNVGEGDAQHRNVKLGPGSCFGERSLLSGTSRNFDVTALSDTVTALIMSKEQFESKLGPLQDLLNISALANLLRSIPIFGRSEFENHEYEDLAKEATLETFAEKHIIARAGKPTVSCLHVVRQGKIQISDEKKGTVNMFVHGDYFNDDLLQYDSSKGELISTKTIEVIEDAKVSVLSQESIIRVLGSTSRLGKPLPPISAKLDRTMKLDDLQKERVLGLGAFGKVWLVQSKTNNAIYALKTLDKKQIIKHKLDKHVMREKNIMASVDHPFIINLITTFKDTQSLYLLINFIQGGELFTVVHKEDSDGVDNDAARFYAAGILESLSHLHKRNICYRDLKPENVLIDKDGYCILIDMGFAKVVLDKTFTMCGTPEYLSPELILHKGHNRGADDWAFGVLVYELIVGQSPFYRPGTTQQSMYKRIVSAAFAFPDKYLHGIDVVPNAQDLIKKLLARDPQNRLGIFANGDDDIKNHPWFDGIFDSDDLINKKIKAPWKPDIKDDKDASNFEDYSEESNTRAQWYPDELSPEQHAKFDDF